MNTEVMKVHKLKSLTNSLSMQSYLLKIGFNKLIFTYFLTSLFLSSCKQIDQPNYWKCYGKATQVVQSQDHENVETYEGDQKLMIEVFLQSVSQFASPATFGRYELCLNTSEKMVFKFPSCESLVLNDDATVGYVREGILQKPQGLLTFKEQRVLGDKKIISNGSYSCRYLGSSYSYKDLNLENN